jgi:hypothetical protein
MAAANSYLQVTELDFADIRNNLKSYLSTQDQFKDFDFEGSTMAVLLDLLAYNTHYNSYYVNMLANEMFLDTAQQRDSVVSFAKALGYTPVSAIGATANIQVQFTGFSNTVNQVTIPRNSKFTTTIDDVQYTYVTPEAYTVIRNSDDDTFKKNITIKEGLPLTHRWVYDSSNPKRFIIPNKNVDITSIRVSVNASQVDSEVTQYTRATNINQIFSTSTVYFIEEAADEKYEIVFGQGALGKKIVNGNVVQVEYLVCNGDETNGAKTFSIDTLNVGQTYQSARISVVNTSARGGRPPETIDSIKFNAPRNFQTQNRAVIDNDYERILLSENPDLQSVTAYGGEKANPPVYGKVFIAAKPYGEQYVTETRKQQLKESISNRTSLAIDPVFVDADYIYLIPMVTTYFDKTNSTETNASIEDAIRTAIEDFSSKNLERFGNRLRYSRFVRSLDNTDRGSILNNDAEIKLEKRFVPDLQRKTKIELAYSNPITQGTLDSTQFQYNGFDCFLDDDSTGKIRIIRFNDQKQKVPVESSAGTIDYETGDVVINAFLPTGYSGIEMKVGVFSSRLDVIPVREQILIMNAQEAQIKVIAEVT